MSALEDCIAGRIAPTIAVARMLLAGHDAAAILHAADQASDPHHPTLATVRTLVRDRPRALDGLAAQVAATAGGHDATGPDGMARIAAFFDHAVGHSPEASVALYSLGDPVLLQAATAEIIDWLHTEGLLPPDADVLDLGCGIGRIAAALAPTCRSVLGLDVSAGMVAEAARRLAGLSNVTLRQTGGEHLDDLAPESFDLILAIDSFPYVIQNGSHTVASHIDGAVRALRPGGALCILNLSYRGDDGQDRADAAEWAASRNLTLLHGGARPFAIWDGSAFVLRR